jgi:hypothetical protein
MLYDCSRNNTIEALVDGPVTTIMAINILKVHWQVDDRVDLGKSASTADMEIPIVRSAMATRIAK